MDSTRGVRDSTIMHHAVTTHTVKLFHSEYSTNIHHVYWFFSTSLSFQYLCGHSRRTPPSATFGTQSSIDRPRRASCRRSRVFQPHAKGRRRSPRVVRSRTRGCTTSDKLHCGERNGDWGAKSSQRHRGSKMNLSNLFLIKQHRRCVHVVRPLWPNRALAHLRALGLSRNRITDEGCATIAQALVKPISGCWRDFSCQTMICLVIMRTLSAVHSPHRLTPCTCGGSIQRPPSLDRSRAHRPPDTAQLRVRWWGSNGGDQRQE